MEAVSPPDTLKLIVDPDQCLLYGAFIRASRALLGLSQEEFRQSLGVSRSTLVRLENGIAPLKKSLCEAAVDVLISAGIKSQAMVEIRFTPGVPTDLDIAVNYGALLNRFLHVPRSAEVQAKLQALFGDDFVAPLKKMPLRKK
jgi:transcriptional regulator with XRE-family HTH domain